jgi:DNA-binding NtrC family response regulator
MTSRDIPLSRMRLLLVEGDQGERARLCRGLEKRFCIWEAATAEDALRVCEDHWVSIVLANYALADHDGVWLLERIAQLHPHMHRVLMSDRAVHNVRGLRDSGVFRLFVAKPVEPEGFSAYFAPRSDLAG